MGALPSEGKFSIPPITSSMIPLSNARLERAISSLFWMIFSPSVRLKPLENSSAVIVELNLSEELLSVLFRFNVLLSLK